MTWRGLFGPEAAIRVRLALALAIALVPVLILSVVQAGLNFQTQARDERADLAAAAVRSGAAVKARIESAQVLLQTLAPGSTGVACSERLAEAASRIPGYDNLIRFDTAGRVVCAADSVPADPARAGRPWFAALAGGAPLVLTSRPGASYASEPAVLAAVRGQDPDGRFAGALAAVMTLESLRPMKADLPPGAQAALTDANGRWLSSTDLARFAPVVTPKSQLNAHGPLLWVQHDRTGRRRTFVSAPLVDDEVYVVISAPSRGLISWTRLNPVSALALPILAFTLALAAVLIVSERGVVRWIAYLQRIAEIYARGRFSVRSVQAERAPKEIRDLAATLDDMATAIVARDEALKDHLAQKDAMLLEIHHRVKNNLQVISSLLNMQQRALTDPAARTAISDTRLRIAALALVYRALYQSPDMRRVDLRQFLEELVGQLVMGEGGQQLAAKTDFSCDEVVIDPDRLAPIALFAVEAISNACKHGLEQGGALSVAFRVRGGDAELTIADSGHPGRPSRLGVGVGRTLMGAFARQLRGEASFTPNPRGGLTARLAFPIPESDAEAAAGADGAGEAALSRAVSPAAAR